MNIITVKEYFENKENKLLRIMDDLVIIYILMNTNLLYYVYFFQLLELDNDIWYDIKYIKIYKQYPCSNISLCLVLYESRYYQHIYN